MIDFHSWVTFGYNLLAFWVYTYDHIEKFICVYYIVIPYRKIYVNSSMSLKYAGIIKQLCNFINPNFMYYYNNIIP